LSISDKLKGTTRILLILGWHGCGLSLFGGAPGGLMPQLIKLSVHEHLYSNFDDGSFALEMLGTTIGNEEDELGNGQSVYPHFD
jgi:hypothetical protein